MCAAWEDEMTLKVTIDTMDGHTEMRYVTTRSVCDLYDTVPYPNPDPNPASEPVPDSDPSTEYDPTTSANSNAHHRHASTC